MPMVRRGLTGNKITAFQVPYTTPAASDGQPLHRLGSR
jgi:hypothetical protein